MRDKPLDTFADIRKTLPFTEVDEETAERDATEVEEEEKEQEQEENWRSRRGGKKQKHHESEKARTGVIYIRPCSNMGA